MLTVRPILEADTAEFVRLAAGTGEVVPLLPLLVPAALLPCAVSTARRWEAGALVDVLKPCLWPLFVWPHVTWSLLPAGTSNWLFTWPCEACGRSELFPAGGGGTAADTLQCPLSGGSRRAPGSKGGPEGEGRSGQDSGGAEEGIVPAVSPLCFVLYGGR